MAKNCPDCKCCASFTRPNVPVPSVVDSSKSRSLKFSRGLGKGSGIRFLDGLTGDDSRWVSAAEDRLVGEALIVIPELYVRPQ